MVSGGRVLNPKEAARPRDPKKIPLSIYIHWPWCVRKCPYCDFNSRKAPSRIPEDRYIDALLRDIRDGAGSLRDQGAGRPVRTVYIGGGTPSLMSPRGMERLISSMRCEVDLAPLAEISMEANPGTVTLESLEGYRKAGVNRISIGLQSLNDRLLAGIRRIHDRSAAIEAAAVARKVFDNMNLDVMYGLPGESMQDLVADVEDALALRADHYSFYELTVEEGTAFAKRPPAGIPDADERSAMADYIRKRLRKDGVFQYEVSGYARKGKECRHNLNYWTYGDYIAAGAGAHGKTSSGRAVFRHAIFKSPEVYLRRSEGNRDRFSHTRTVTNAEAAFEFMLDALRLEKGFGETLFEERTGVPLEAVPALPRAVEEGLLTRKNGVVKATGRGRKFLSDLQEMFLPEPFE